MLRAAWLTPVLCASRAAFQGARNWNKLNARTKDVLSNMPFMENWNTAIT